MLLWTMFVCSLKKLHSPMLSVMSEAFMPILTRLDECITYLSAHVSSFLNSRYRLEFFAGMLVTSVESPMGLLCSGGLPVIVMGTLTSILNCYLSLTYLTLATATSCTVCVWRSLWCNGLCLMFFIQSVLKSDFNFVSMCSLIPVHFQKCKVLI